MLVLGFLLAWFVPELPLRQVSGIQSRMAEDDAATVAADAPAGAPAPEAATEPATEAADLGRKPRARGRG